MTRDPQRSPTPDITDTNSDLEVRSVSHEQAAHRGHIILIGGGAIGLSSAYHLLRAGFTVTVLERNEYGQGASWGNAGWVVPSLIQPFNSPGAASQALRGLHRPSSPVALRQFPTWSLARWGLEFLRASSVSRSNASMRSLATLTRGAAEDVVALAGEIGFEVHRTGLLEPFRSQAALDSFADAHAKVEALGYTGRVEILDAEEVKIREPALSDDVVGGVHLLDEVSVNPESMTTALARAVIDGGGEIIEHQKVLAFDQAGNGGWHVRTQDRVLKADAVVVAAGEHSPALLRSHGIRVPLQSGRGCSVNLPSSVLMINQPMKIAEFQVACTPFDSGEVRISGTFDLVQPDAGTAVGRMRTVLRSASNYLPALKDFDVSSVNVWSGARPNTPDSLPIVGPVGKVPGLYAATGHGTLGITLAICSGRTLAESVSTTLARPARNRA